MARVAFIVDEMFEDSEFQVPYDEVKGAGHEAVIVGVEAGKRLKGKKGMEITTEVAAKGLTAKDFDALVIPGGYSPDKLRMSRDMVGFTREFFTQDKPIAAICHAGWMLAEADVLDGKTVTSYPSIRTDLLNAGAKWVDRELVEDGRLITSRNPNDLPVFSRAILGQLKGSVSADVSSGAERGAQNARPGALH